MIRSEVEKILTSIIDAESGVARLENLVVDGYIDSFDVLRLVNELEKKFKVKVSFGEGVISSFYSLDTIVELIEKLTEEKIDG